MYYFRILLMNHRMHLFHLHRKYDHYREEDRMMSGRYPTKDRVHFVVQ
jgi:hypothetical protein